MIKMIAAKSLNNVIGRDGSIPWRLPEDMHFFKATTFGHVVVMGMKTFESLGKPLKGRRNVVITRRRHLEIPDVVIYHSFKDAMNEEEIRILEGTEPEDIFLIGGASIYRQALESLEFIPETIYLTEVEAYVEGDTFFPSLSGLYETQLIRAATQKLTLLQLTIITPDTKPWYPHRIYKLTRRHF